MATRVLIVDDESEDLNTMKQLLETAGYSVDTAITGSEALQKAAAHPFALILLDIRMPALSGYELLQLMKKRVHHAPKIIFVSIIPEQDTNMEGADGFIQKPFDPDLFTAQIRKILRN